MEGIDEIMETMNAVHMADIDDFDDIDEEENRKHSRIRPCAHFQDLLFSVHQPNKRPVPFDMR